METIRVLITGGGSSGHVSPALAVIEAIKELEARPDAGWKAEFLYVGSRQGIERGLVESRGIPFVWIETGKLRRYFSLKNLTDPFRVVAGCFGALAHVTRFKPSVVLSTGGYVAVPTVIAASMRGVPVLVHEQTVQLGLANRITARFVTRIALSFEATLKGRFSESIEAKMFVTGNPVRSAIFGGDRNEAIRWAGFDPAEDLPTVYVTGGSLGARILNRAVEQRLADLLRVCRVIHQCGEQPNQKEKDYDRLRAAADALPAELRRHYHVAPFIRAEINHVYALADLVVGRAGANTIVENCTLGKPAIYIPMVPSAGDEQTKNARMCENIDAAAVLPQTELTGDRLRAQIMTMLGDREHLTAMGKAATLLAMPHAAHDLAVAAVSLARHGWNNRRGKGY